MSIPVPVSRPRTIAVTFWCWVVSAILTAAFGMLLLSVSTALLFQVAGWILVVVGLAQAYLAGRAYRGQQRFANAGVGLAMASVAFLAVLLVVGAIAIFGVLLVALIMVLLITGSVMSQRPASREWFESQDVA